MLKLVHELTANRFALRNQFYVDTKVTVATTRLGVLWWILDPLFLMLIYYFLVNVIFHRGTANYHLFLLCGLATYQFFSRSISLCTGALVRNECLIKQVPLPMIIYVTISPLVQGFFCLISYIIVAVLNYQALGWYTPLILVPIFLIILIAFTAGIFLSIFEVYVRDVGKLVSYVLRFGLYLSPVLYEASKVFDNPNIPEFIKHLYSLNPMVHIITAVQDILYHGRMFDPVPLIIIFGVVLVFMQVGLLFFRKNAPQLPKIL